MIDGDCMHFFSQLQDNASSKSKSKPIYPFSRLQKKRSLRCLTHSIRKIILQSRLSKKSSLSISVHRVRNFLHQPAAHERKGIFLLPYTARITLISSPGLGSALYRLPNKGKKRKKKSAAPRWPWNPIIASGSKVSKVQLFVVFVIL